MGFRVGVDIGGTFTDAVAVGDDGTLRTAKALTTPGVLADGVLAAVAGLDVTLDEVDSFVHGTTAGLNAFLERRGSRVALLTTRGFRDVYEIGRANRPAMYDLRFTAPKPLVPRRDIHEIDERLAPDGSTVTELDVAQVESLARELDGTVDAVAVVLLHAYANPVHEKAIAEIFARVAPTIAVVCSSDIAPEWREYERTSTTAVSAYIAPIVLEYLRVLESSLQDGGLSSALKVMQSNGGVMTVDRARERAVQTLFSGPVGGTMAGVAVANDLGLDKLLCVDMGGTSFDVSLVVDGEADIASQTELEGHPLLAPSVVMHTIGAGGGSVAHVVAGALRVGPRSAGSVPGPASYGRGGTEPTVTDANLLLGRLPDVALLGGTLALDKSAARDAAERVGDALGLDVEQTALGIVAVADAAMANAIREITVARGIDPRDFGLLAFGGAGPLHAVSIADELELGQVIVPGSPGVLSAWGMVHTDLRHDLVQSFFHGLDDLGPDVLKGATTALLDRGAALLDTDGVAPDQVDLAPGLDVRYLGQEYTLTVGFDPDAEPEEVLAGLQTRFDAEHLERFGHNNPGEKVEVVALRLVARGLTPRPPAVDSAAGDEPVVLGQQSVRYAGDTLDSVVYDRASVRPGRAVAGPAILLEPGCTVLVPPGWVATPSAHGHLVLERSAS
ncbi:hydantoinase/oxoprolinase family protein [Amnibacterium flavum]|uniref:5-oxoprolinase n=1 Tax=Amnibacterium flavum TaxID=2173173 RepID=A0A2V1HXL1_9MICO|nr:hydantoinase/oxoprolinase family protein [Amnibacterium flavum]PVZ96079.1 5-oxoprolinase [Amnibacterium flavum]